MSEKIRLLIVDDSGITREILKKIVEEDRAIQVIGMAENGKRAIELVQTLKPDVVIMDINMPVMNGFEATEQIMAYCPTPILILSSVIDKEGIYTTFNALAAGAVDVMEKPSRLPNDSWDRIGSVLVKKLKLISRAKVVTHIKGRVKEFYRPVKPVSLIKPNTYEIIGIGASTGGPSVVMQILKHIPSDYDPGILVVQHMAEGFIDGFMKWLGNACKVKVKLAQEGEKIEKGQVLIAPDGFHTIVRGRKSVGLISGNPVNGVKPSVDILFDSIAEVYGESAIGVLLTGMGADGAEGLKHIKDKGGITIVQSEDSCAVFGMPKVAIEKGAASRVLSVEDIIRTLKGIVNNNGQ
ncbi:MAG TPA: chemotaxis-specific protein-glutamate methyltransferase CheB [Candidatus Wunengus sp. YC60]|uniref:chemotaxis-specific protein-glutamate methyltransferase CheB n=1 Tax=Candidatus Wunengus sp. YC60 TaxID=3367697 RepID=UPI00402708C2